MRTRNTSLTTDQKALAVNLDKYKYGSIVKIGAVLVLEIGRAHV